MKFVYVLLTTLVLGVGGCKSPGKNQNALFSHAEVIRENTEVIQDTARDIMVQSEVIAEQVQINDKALRTVLEEQGTVGAQPVAERLSEALGANAAILEARQGINLKAHQIDEVAGTITVSADTITRAAGRVEDVPSFWERLSTSIRRLILIALGLVVIIIGWRFGLDKIVKSIMGLVSGGIESASEWAHRKYQGPVKLLKEGKTGEAIAALRSAIPRLDESFKRSDSGA